MGSGRRFWNARTGTPDRLSRCAGWPRNHSILRDATSNSRRCASTRSSSRRDSYWAFERRRSETLRVPAAFGGDGYHPWTDAIQIDLEMASVRPRDEPEALKRAEWSIGSDTPVLRSEEHTSELQSLR